MSAIRQYVPVISHRWHHRLPRQATARYLLARNAVVYALVRNPTSTAAQALQKGGAVIFKDEFNNIAAIEGATEGATSIFLNLSLTKKPFHQVF